MTTNSLRSLCLALGMTGAAAPVMAVVQMPPLTMHGALAQGYVRSTGNNYYGDSMGSGSRDLYEVALNGSMSLHPKLLVTGQLMARREGSQDRAEIRVDFLQADYQVVTTARGSFGLRLGKLKNPYGLYNASRDVVFSRPGITMPASVYFTGLGLRDLLFSTEAGQLYGSWQWGNSVSEFVAGVAPTFDATSLFTRAFGLSDEFSGLSIKARDFTVAQWSQDWGLGQLRTAVSYLGARLTVSADDPNAFAPVDNLDADLWVASVQWQNPLSSVTGEYLYSYTCTQSFQGSDCSSSDGAYVQYRRIATPTVSWFLRYDLRWSDRNDRSGREYAQQTGRDRADRYSRDHVLGADWKFSPGWGLFAEYHYIIGAAQASRVDNPDGEIDDRSQMLLLMLGYRF